MESLTKLEEALKAFKSDLRTQDSKRSATEGDIEGLTDKKSKLSKEVEDLEKRKAEHIDFLGQSESNLKKEYEAKTRELRVKSDNLDRERGQFRGKEIQMEQATQAALESKVKSDKLYSEYEKKMAELNHKREAVLNALK